ncbi:MAG: TatD family hydrolase [Balneolaceae bacterium]
MQLADTHSHLYLDAFQKDLEDVLNRAAEADITRIYLPAIDWNSLDEMEGLQHDTISFFKMMGVHPCEITGSRLKEKERLMETCSRDDIVAVGETGLDYYWSTDHVKNQKESLRMHCGVAKAVGKPVVLHNRESTDDLLEVIEEEQDGNLTGVWHCFTGTEEEGKRALDLGLYLGVGGVATFKNAGVGEVVARLPLDRMLLETDAPYLAPTPRRGDRNEPSFMLHTARKLSGLQEKPLEEIARVTTSNATALFQTE